MVNIKNAVNKRRRVMSSWVKNGRFDLEAYIDFFEIPVKVAARDAKVLGYCETSTYGSFAKFLSNHQMSSPITPIELSKLKNDRESFLKENKYSDEALEAFGLWHIPSRHPFKGENEIEIMFNKGYPREVVRQTFGIPYPDFVILMAGKESAEVIQALTYHSEIESILDAIISSPSPSLTSELENDLITVWSTLQVVAGLKTQEEGIASLSKLGIEVPKQKIQSIYEKVKNNNLDTLETHKFSQAVERLKNMANKIPQKKQPFCETNLYELTGLSISKDGKTGEIEKLLNVYKKYGTITILDKPISPNAAKTVDSNKKTSSKNINATKPHPMGKNLVVCGKNRQELIKNKKQEYNNIDDERI